MTLELIIRTLHFMAIFGLLTVLAMQNALLSPVLAPEKLKRLARLDALYGLSAMVVLAAGLLLWLGVGKPSSFYTENSIFMVKISVFVLVGLASIFPTIFVVNNRHATQDITAPGWLKITKRLELLFLLTLPMLAVPMARGIGLGA